MADKNMTITLIVTTYNWKEALELVLLLVVPRVPTPVVGLHPTHASAL